MELIPNKPDKNDWKRRDIKDFLSKIHKLSNYSRSKADWIKVKNILTNILNEI
jgi:hypothetical protein